ncbi:hypothetical protein SCHPADRAFT_893940 [Schizopora paradoxa]|uniref:HypA-like protein n=1 Tax=Schizopora paradoxa TaxID=27342 RepID=A0A0H2RFQ5_9AGAM|nr:hypothetical protein SCHPADRAFT_893940 [Schizopora paradoxa]
MSAPTPELLARLFPTPSSPPRDGPMRVFGVSTQSTETLVNLLKDNHKKFHVFFNHRGFHNHNAHHMLAVYALGGTGKVIEAAYERTSRIQRPAYVSTITITDSNYFEHLGKEDNYNAFLKYFSYMFAEKEDLDMGEEVENFIFSEKYNFDRARKGGDQPQPQMLNRFLAGLLHPIIHTGYGVEFGLRGTLAEGLAQVSVHRVEAPKLIPESFFDFSEPGSTGAVSYLTSMLPRLSLRQPSATADSAATGDSGHLFAILARMLKDPRLDVENLKFSNNDLGDHYHDVVAQVGDVISEHTAQWDLRLTGDATQDAAILNAKVEEMYWTQILIYGIGGFTAEGFLADFVYMHLVTSALFLPSFLAVLKKPASKTTLLRSYMSISLAWWVSCGRPGFAISKFYEGTGGANPDNAAQSPIPGPQPVPNEKALKFGDKPCLLPNPWYSILQTALTYPNDHVCKLQRSLVHADSLYSSRPAGHFKHLKALPEFDGAGVGPGGLRQGFEGIEKLDGSLFVRVARLTMDRMGWMREGQDEKRWDFVGESLTGGIAA